MQKQYHQQNIEPVEMPDLLGLRHVVGNRISQLPVYDFEIRRQKRNDMFLEYRAVYTKFGDSQRIIDEIISFNDEVAAQLRRGLRQEIAKTLDEDLTPVLVAPTGFGKTSTVNQLFKDAGNGFRICFRQYTSLDAGLDSTKSHVDSNTLLLFDEISFEPKDVMAAVKKLKKKGKKPILAYRPYMYDKTYTQRVYGEDSEYREIRLPGFSVEDEKRLCSGFGIEKTQAQSLMEQSQGHPIFYETFFKTLMDDDGIKKYIESLKNPHYLWSTGKIIYFDLYEHEPGGSMYSDIMPAVKKAASCGDLTVKERELALSSGIVLERSGCLNIPKPYLEMLK